MFPIFWCFMVLELLTREYNQHHLLADRWRWFEWADLNLLHKKEQVFAKEVIRVGVNQFKYYLFYFTLSATSLCFVFAYNHQSAEQLTAHPQYQHQKVKIHNISTQWFSVFFLFLYNTHILYKYNMTFCLTVYIQAYNVLFMLTRNAFLPSSPS